MSNLVVRFVLAAVFSFILTYSFILMLAAFHVPSLLSVFFVCAIAGYLVAWLLD